MKSARTAMFAAAVVLLALAFAAAQGMHGHGGHGDFNHMLGFFTDYLDLSADQQSQIKAIWAKEKPTLEPLWKQEHQNRADMHALQLSGPFDEAKTRALATQQAQTQIELEVQHARVMSEMMQVLTPDQKTNLSQMQAKHQARMREHASEPED